MLVRYDPADPARVDLARGMAQPSVLGGVLLAVGIGIVLVGLFVLGFWALIVLVLRVPV